MRAGPRAGRRLRRHLLLAAASSVVTLWLSGRFPGTDLRQHLSLALGYVALMLLVVTLAVGPLNVLRQRPNPVSSDLRRDLGIWAGILGLAHTVVGLTVHFRGRMYLYFLAPPERPSPILLRLDPFGFTNDAGLVAALVTAMLLAISNDRALGALGATRWKRLQRATYPMAILITAHGFAYQVLEHRPFRFVALMGLIVAAGVLPQWVGWRETRSRTRALRPPSRSQP